MIRSRVVLRDVIVTRGGGWTFVGLVVWAGGEGSGWGRVDRTGGVGSWAADGAMLCRAADGADGADGVDGADGAGHGGSERRTARMAGHRSGMSPLE